MKNLILRMAVILAAAAMLFYIGCNDGADSDVTSGGHVDDLIDKTHGTNEPKEQVSHTLKVTASPAVGGSVSKSPDKPQYSKGESVMVTATAKTGYRFTGWTGDTASTNTGITIKIDGKKELVANFLQEDVVSYTLTINTSPTAGGTVSKSPDKLEYAAGEMVYVTAAPKPGYAFTIWSGTSSSRDSAITITMNDKKELTANFAPRTYTLTVNEENGGSVSRNPGKSAYDYNEKVIVTAYPDNNYKFKEWSGAATGTKNPITVTIDDDKTLSASFEWIGTTPPTNEPETKYTLTVYPSPTDGGEVSRNPDKNAYTSGEKVTVTAYPANGYKFTGWLGAATSANTSITVTMDGDKSLTAGFELITYTVTFNANGGSGTIPNQNAQSGNSITLPSGNNLSKTGSTFGGWSTNSSGTGRNYSGGSSFFVTDDVTLYAKWETIPTYTVTFNANGGSGSIPSQRAQEGEPVPLPDGSRLSRNSYTFGGWNTNSSGTGINYNVGSYYTVMDDVTLYAVWNNVPVTMYTVSFIANGGNGSVSSQIAQAGSTITLPNGSELLSRSGYAFSGWNTNSSGNGTTYSVGSPFSVTDDVTLYAKWEIIPTHTITFNANGGTVTTASGTTGTDGRLASLQTPTRTGYTFDGWYTAATGGTAVTPSTVFSANTTIYAQWTLITYTITFNANGGTVNSVSGTTGEGGRLASLPTPTRDGYTSNGWYTAATGGTKVTESREYSGSATIYAQWTLITYTITFNANSGTVSPTSGTTGEGGKLTSLPAPTRSGYTFNGWYTASTGGTAVTTSTTFSANTTIYAQWTLNTYTITFNANSGTVSPTSGTTGEDKRLASLPTPTRSGYIFVGWYTAATGGTAVTESREYSANATIYARWVAIYTVTFDANGGTVSPTSGTTDADKRLASLPTPTRSDYTFNGWFTTKTGSTAVTESREYSANTTIYAQWIRTYTVTFNANGGSGSAPSAQTVNSGSSITLPSQGSLTRTGYRFVGWNSESSGGGRNYPANFTFTPERTFTLYAIWDWVGKGNDISNYKTISIGEQRWMAENLDYNVEGSKCYGNSADSCAKYGRLYTWTTAMGGASSSSANPSGVQGVCPVGWHLPSDGEWTTLTNYVGSGAGTKLKSQSGWVDGNGTDEYGFSALPGGTDAQGSGCYGAEWCDAGFRGSWWSATAPASDGATYRTMRYDIDYVHIYTFYKSKFFSIRCVAD